MGLFLGYGSDPMYDIAICAELIISILSSHEYPSYDYIYYRISYNLLESDFRISFPKVGDFGLARWQPDGDMGVDTRVIGTFG